MFNQTLTKRQTVISSQLKKLANPMSQSKMATLVPEEGEDEPSAASKLAMNDEPDWWDQFVQDSDITDDQIRGLRQLRQQHLQAFKNLQLERKELNAEIGTFYRETQFSFSNQLVSSFHLF
jgi:hypothetical protein